MKYEVTTKTYFLGAHSQFSNRDTSTAEMLNEGYTLIGSSSFMYPSKEIGIIDTFSRPLAVEED